MPGALTGARGTPGRTLAVLLLPLPMSNRYEDRGRRRPGRRRPAAAGRPMARRCGDTRHRVLAIDRAAFGARQDEGRKTGDWPKSRCLWHGRHVDEADCWQSCTPLRLDGRPGR